MPVLTPVGPGTRGRAGTARGGTANHRIAPPTVWVSPIGRLLQAGKAPHASSRRRNIEAVRKPPLTGLTDRAMLAPSGVAGTDQPRSHLRDTPPRQLSDREIRTAKQSAA
jgi:hypothetical protein